MGSHSRFAPSKGRQWMKCAVSVPRTEAIEAVEGEHDAGPEAQWGTDSHGYLEKGVSWGLPPSKFAGLDADEKEKAACADMAYNYVLPPEGRSGPYALHSEVRVDPGVRTPVENLAAGTADLALVTPEMLEVDDFKTGRKVVEPNDPQLILYLLGALKIYWPDRTQPLPFQILRSGVIQPRAPHKKGPIRTQDFPLDFLLDYEQRMIRQIQSADDPNTPAVPGEEQCRYCRAKPNCAEHAQWAKENILASLGIVASEAQADITGSISTALTVNRERHLPAAELSHVLELIPSIEAWFDSVRKEVRRRLEQREPVPGWKLARAKARPKWLHDAETIAKKLRAIKGISKKFYMKDALKTPLQVMAEVPEDLAPRVEKLWERPKGAIVVVPDTDPRPDPLDWVDTIKTEQE